MELQELKQGIQYSWDPNTATFSLNAKQFGTLYNSLSAIVSSPVFQEKLVHARETLGIMELHTIMNEVLQVAVSNGTATEAAQTVE